LVIPYVNNMAVTERIENRRPGLNADLLFGEGKMLIRNAYWSTFYPPSKAATQRVKC